MIRLKDKNTRKKQAQLSSGFLDILTSSRSFEASFITRMTVIIAAETWVFFVTLEPLASVSFDKPGSAADREKFVF